MAEEEEGGGDDMDVCSNDEDAQEVIKVNLPSVRPQRSAFAPPAPHVITLTLPMQYHAPFFPQWGPSLGPPPPAPGFPSPLPPAFRPNSSDLAIYNQLRVGGVCGHGLWEWVGVSGARKIVAPPLTPSRPARST